jgi:hypothetical protein
VGTMCRHDQAWHMSEAFRPACALLCKIQLPYSQAQSELYVRHLQRQTEQHVVCKLSSECRIA